jgi:hypothetical protein
MGVTLASSRCLAVISLMCRALISLLRRAVISLLCWVIIIFPAITPSRPFIGPSTGSDVQPAHRKTSEPIPRKLRSHTSDVISKGQEGPDRTG